MNPKTKLQKQVVELSVQLPSITDKQQEWAFEHCFEHSARRIKKGITCLECGHTWKDEAPHLLTTIDGYTCPACSRKLVVKDTKKRTFEHDEYFCIITTIQGFQVFRYFYMKAQTRVGEKMRYSIDEVVQRWLAPDGRYETLAMLRAQSFNYYDVWALGSALEIRSNKDHPAYEIYPAGTYPDRKFIPEAKRNGVRSKGFMSNNPFKLIQKVLSDSKAETLLKAKQYDLLKEYIAYPPKIGAHWTSVKICMRNNYIVKDATLWADYIHALQYLDKDIRNAKYVCPKNLKEEHDRYVAKKRKLETMRRQEENRKKAIKEEVKFKELKERFFGLVFAEEELTVMPLESINDHYDEGSSMHHCVGSSSYYLSANSLILSARIKGERIATIEFSLKTLKVTQCRGVNNKVPDYYKRIIELVEKNVGLIRKRINPKRETKAGTNLMQVAV